MKRSEHIWFREQAEPTYKQVGEILRAMAELRRTYRTARRPGDEVPDLSPNLLKVLEKLENVH